jgi:hypothetical protein
MLTEEVMRLLAQNLAFSEEWHIRALSYLNRLPPSPQRSEMINFVLGIYSFHTLAYGIVRVCMYHELLCPRSAI